MRKGTLFILLGAMVFAAIIFVLLSRVQPVKVIDSHLERDGENVFVAGGLRNRGAHPGPPHPVNPLLRPRGPAARRGSAPGRPTARRRAGALSRPCPRRGFSPGFLALSQPGTQSVRQLTGALSSARSRERKPDA